MDAGDPRQGEHAPPAPQDAHGEELRAEREPAAGLPSIPFVADAAEHPSGPTKPTWRGWIHAGTFPVAVAAGILLIALADGAAAKWSAAVYLASSTLLFGVSAVYHRFTWSAAANATLRRLDHSNIFLLIAGSYTPLAVGALEYPKSAILLTIVWSGALLGIAFRIFWLQAPRWLYTPLYVALGFGAFIYIVDLFQSSPVSMILILGGGVFYIVGAAFYAFKAPNPIPGVFGFHELFHSCTVLAFLAQWVGILLVVLHPVGG
jgi:hemolysin III